MKQFLRHMYIAFLLWKMGFFFSKNTHDGEKWGFYRINHGETYAIIDIDFDLTCGDYSYFHIHGGPEETNYQLLYKYLNR